MTSSDYIALYRIASIDPNYVDEFENSINDLGDVLDTSSTENVLLPAALNNGTDEDEEMFVFKLNAPGANISLVNPNNASSE